MRSRNFWTIDAETDPFHSCDDLFCLKCHGQGRVPKPFVWGAYNGVSEEYIEFVETRELADFFRDKKTVVYAHNGGRFDYHYMRDEINSDENIMVIAGRLAKFRIGVCEFRDSMNIFQQTALKEFGGKIEIDYAKMEVDRRSDPNIAAEISMYLKQDCVLLWEKLDEYFQKYGRGLTQAGCAMRVWSRMSGVKPPSQTKEQFKRYKPFYYGGRVECFKQGVKDENFKVVDINSAYPYAMLSKHPFSPSASIDDRLPVDDAEIQRSLIHLRAVSEGAFPYRAQTGELFFPCDNERREYHVTGWEYLAALEHEAVSDIEIVEVHTFPLSIDFKEYVHHFYEQRKEAKKTKNKAEDIFCKLFLNSLYGKMGSNPAGIDAEGNENPADGYQEYLIASDESIDTHVVEGFQDYKPWGERRLMIRPLPEIRHTFYNVATAASITGFVRAMLFRASRQCRGVIYGDTDSLSAVDVSQLSIGDELGQWKVELDCKKYAVAGKKNYAFEALDESIMKYHAFQSREAKTGHWKIASKGAKLTPEELLRVASGEIVTYRPESPTYSITHNEPKFINRVIRRTSLARSEIV